MTPESELGPVGSPAALRRKQTPDFLPGFEPSPNLLEAPASEVMIRIARRQGELYWRRVGSPVGPWSAELYRNLRQWCERHGFHPLAAWHAGLAHHAREGIAPSTYAQDVIRRARAHQRNALRGRPWVKQR
jgi:hypothetical protein